MSHDCRRCGACCINLPSNQAEGYTSWVEIEPDDRILRRRALVRKLVVHDSDGVPHLRLAPDGRCAALRGTPGKKVRCAIYVDRPTPCHTVQPGSELCEWYRAEQGITA